MNVSVNDVDFMHGSDLIRFMYINWGMHGRIQDRIITRINKNRFESDAGTVAMKQQYIEVYCVDGRFVISSRRTTSLLIDSFTQMRNGYNYVARFGKKSSRPF